MARALAHGLATATLSIALAWAGAAHAEGGIEKFFGTFAGKGVAHHQEGEASERDMSVQIQPAEKGFTLEWTTVTGRAEGTPKSKNYRIRFLPTERDNVYSSGMRTNMFGRAVPMDPLKGDPYVWAIVQDDVLKVYVMEITEAFGYEMQVYERRLTEGGMTVKFSRVRNGERMRDVEADLVRVPG